MAKLKSKDHAEHNEQVCDYLDKNPNFCDWVITTSFYSSLHYLRHKIFPVKVKIGKIFMPYDDFDSYHRALNLSAKRVGRHDRFKDLVEEKCPSDVSIGYSRLLELSYSARYVDYNYEKDVVNEAKTSLTLIKEHCVKKTIPSASKK